jgi:arylsulfatase A-like enzyme
MAVYDVAPTLYEFAGIDPQIAGEEAGVADDRRQL